MDIKRAVMELFHMHCPHPTRYVTDEGQIDVKSFEADLKIWMSATTATWISFKNTDHDKDCTCCIAFRQVATNYDDFLKLLLSEEELYHKRVARNQIIRWAEAVQSQTGSESFKMMLEVGKSLLQGETHGRISDITTDSSNMSDTSDTEGKISVETEIQYAQHNKDERIMLAEYDSSESDTQHSTKSSEKSDSRATLKRLRRRKTAKRPLDTIIEISDISNEITNAIPSLGKAVRILVKHDEKGPGRSEFCTYIQIFLKQIIKTKEKFSLWDILSYKKRLQIHQSHHKKYKTIERRLDILLDERGVKYTTRSAKRRREMITNM